MSPAWIDALAARAGPLANVAVRFARTHRAAPEIVRGDDGLAGLSAAIDSWAETDDATSDEDEAFVEGAGALLAVLLVDELGGAHVFREGEHRVRLGRFGFFDPFGAIDAAMENDEGLAPHIVRARAEAGGTAGYGRVGRTFSERLRLRAPARRVESAVGPFIVLDGGVEVDLTRVVQATDGESERAVTPAVDKLISMIPGVDGRAAAPFDELRDRLFPRLVARGFADALRAESRADLAARPIVGGALEVGLVAAFDDRSRFIRTSELKDWKHSFDEVLALAMRNLADRSVSARLGRVDTDAGPLIVARSGDGLDASRLLLPGLADVLRGELDAPFVAAVPHRDALLACKNVPPLVEALRERAKSDAARAPHAITEQLFVVGDGPLRRRG